jgi:hypothetical protein
MKKTAMQLLIDEINGMKSLLNNQESRVAECMSVIADRATELLEKEQKHIEEAYNCGNLDNDGFSPDKLGEQYFKETYG